jgi:hypothetical protein
MKKIVAKRPHGHVTYIGPTLSRVELSLRPFPGLVNDRRTLPGLYSVFALPQKTTLYV